jgi:AcrR family transcriptional regulator
MMKTSDVRRERERQRREGYRETILHAAEDVIIRKGYSAMTMDDVAREAQYSKATLYKYFPSKGELVFEILIHFFEDIRRKLEEIQAEGGPALEKLRKSVRMIIEFNASKENISRVLLADRGILKILRVLAPGQGGPAAPADRRLAGLLRQKRREASEKGAEILEEGVAAGEFRPMDARAALAFIDAALMGFAHNRTWFDRGTDTGLSADMLFDFIVHGIGKRE